MTLSNESAMSLKIEYLESEYIKALVDAESLDDCISDRVLKALINVCDKVCVNISRSELNTIRSFIAQKLWDELEKYTPDKDSAERLVFLKKTDAFFYGYKLFLDIKESDFADESDYNKILSAKIRAGEAKDFSFIPEIIISFTSFPDRIQTVYKTLSSIYNQSIKPDRVILWLAEDQFPAKEDQLPQSLLDYKQFGFDIRWCGEDIRPHKKYYYAMQEYRDDIIITIDDDIIYDRYMIETLLASYLNHPDAVSALRTHLILADDSGKIRPYRQWKHEFSGVIGVPSMQLLATGCAGILYPPGCIDIDSFTIDDIRTLALNADDMWLKIMQVKNGTPVVLAQENKPLVFVPDSQEVALYKTNSHLNENDIQLADILNRYDIDGNIIKSIFADCYTSSTSVPGVHVVKGNVHSLIGNIVIANGEESLDKCVCGMESLQKEIFQLKDENIRLIDENKKVNKYLADIRNSLSFKIGRIITWLPRYIKSKIKG